MYKSPGDNADKKAVIETRDHQVGINLSLLRDFHTPTQLKCRCRCLSRLTHGHVYCDGNPKKKRKMINSSNAKTPSAQCERAKDYLRSLVSLSAFSFMLVMANVVGVWLPGLPPGVGVVARLGAALGAALRL